MVTNIEAKQKLEEKKAEAEKLHIHSLAISKLYQKKKPIDNSNNKKR